VFIPYVSPTALLGLLFTIVCMFALQALNIVEQWLSVLRVVVPLLLYFATMFLLTFLVSGMWLKLGYPVTVTQSFTAASNNFELAIAVSVGIWGIESPEALAAVVGPLVEVPVLVVLVYVARYFKSSERLFPLRKSCTYQEQQIFCDNCEYASVDSEKVDIK
jgi:ACR3 family arsenite transporter